MQIAPRTQLPSPALISREVTMNGQPVGEDFDFRQLRHHTRNALQRMIAHVHLMPGLAESEDGRALIAEVERRVRQSAGLADALFGFRKEPGGLEHRLREPAGAVVGLFAPSGQEIALAVSAIGDCPATLHHVIVRVVNEMLVNAVRHGLARRAAGVIHVTVSWSHRPARRREVILRVTDDGCGPEAGGTGRGGEGLVLMAEIAAPLAGEVRLLRKGQVTVAEMLLPVAFE